MRQAADRGYRDSRRDYHSRADGEWPTPGGSSEEVFRRSNAYDVDTRSRRPGYSHHVRNNEIQQQVWRGNSDRNFKMINQQTSRHQNYNCNHSNTSRHQNHSYNHNSTNTSRHQNYTHNQNNNSRSCMEQPKTWSNYNQSKHNLNEGVAGSELHALQMQAPPPRVQQKVEVKDTTPSPQTIQEETKSEQKVMGRDYQLLLYKQAVLSRELYDEGWPHIIGNCLDMCPAEERDKRARLRDLAVFERLNGDQSKTSKELAVKKFCRTFSGKDVKQSDIRPLLVLRYTMEHLLKILDIGGYSFEVVHDFLFDRTRAIRQELSMQRITDELAVSIYEKIVRFHIMSERELRKERASGKVFDSHLNSQQLSKALLSLLNLYLVLSSDSGLQNEAEFYSYYVLLNLNQPQQLTLWFQSVSSAVLKSADVQFARDVLKCYEQKNYRGFFRLVTRATYLQACLMELHFNEVRAEAVKMINHGSYKLHPYPLCELANALLMELDDLEEFCGLHGLAVGVSTSNEVQLLAKQAEFTNPKHPVRHYHCQVTENKRPAKFQELCSPIAV